MHLYQVLLPMATDNPTPPDGAKSVVSTDDDNEQFSLSPGEAITARVVQINPVETEFGDSAILTLELEDDGELVDYFAKDEVKRAVNNDALERGGVYWIAKMAETEEVNGNEYNPTQLRQIE